MQKLEILVNGSRSMPWRQLSMRRMPTIKASASLPSSRTDPAPVVRRGHPGFFRRRIISRANVKATRKDVLAKFMAVTSAERKNCLKNKEGQETIEMVGNVEIPQEAFMAVLSLEEE